MEKTIADLRQSNIAPGAAAATTPPVVDPDDLKVLALDFIRSEIAHQNLTLEAGGMRPNKDKHGECLKAFVACLKRDSHVVPLCTPTVFRRCFSTVVKSERRKSDPARYAKCHAGNEQRQWRWRLSERAKGVWARLTADDVTDERKEAGAVVLARDYMPEIRLDNERTFTWVPLPWLSEKAKGIQRQAFVFVVTPTSYSQR